VPQLAQVAFQVAVLENLFAYLISPSCMQTKISKKLAKSPTGQEIRDLLASASAKLTSSACWPEGLEPIWSMDNAVIHHAAAQNWEGQWRKDAGIRGEVMFVPPYSPDLHQCIEHAHANTCRRWRQQLLIMARSKVPYNDVVDMFKDIEACFGVANTEASVAANVCKLVDTTYPEVIRLEGDWPTPAFR